MIEGIQGLVELSRLDTELASREREKAALPQRREECSNTRVACEARLEAAERAGALERSLDAAAEVEQSLQYYADRKENELVRLRARLDVIFAELGQPAAEVSAPEEAVGDPPGC